MKIQRDAVQARNALNFNLVKKAPQVQQDRFAPFVNGFEDKTIYDGLRAAEDAQRAASYRAGDAQSTRNSLGALGLAGTGAGVWAALAGQPLVAGGLALVAVTAAGFGVRAHSRAKVAEGEANLAADAHKAITQAADEIANGLVSDGPGPDQFTDRRYYTGGIISQIATVHSRESGALLRTQVELGGSVPRRLEANVAKNTVAVRSPQGDQTFAGDIKVDDQGIRIDAHGTVQSHDGPLSQEIYPSGSSLLRLDIGNYDRPTLSTDGTVAKKGFEAHAYTWENGQVASHSRNKLYVANPIVPFQDLTNVRVLPDGVVGSKSRSDDTHDAYETSLPAAGALGTWTMVENPQLTSRLIETKFGDGFTAMSDQKAGTIRVSAADGSSLDTQATLVQTNGAFRMQTQHPMGSLEQSLLPGEVLLTLQHNDRTLIVQHKAGGQPTASESKEHEDFLGAGDALQVTLDDKGAYQVQDGIVRTELKPLMSLEFLQKKAPQ